MRPKLKNEIILVFACAAVLFVAGTLKSREDYMKSLPVYKHFKCLLCHTSARPTSAELNVFGADFKANGHYWNGTLARKDSDGDGYTNGIEIGDEQGDGEADIGFERSNPGDRANTPNSIDRGTWGLLKSLFED